MKIDFHLHSNHSFDAWTPVRTVVQYAIRAGLGGFALTDHNAISGWPGAQEFIREKKLALSFVPGCEAMTEYGEVLGLFLTEKIASKNFAEVCDKIHEQGGFAVIPHPFDPLRRSACNPEKLPPELLRHVDGIEAFNARALPPFNSKAQNFARSRQFKLTTGGSDAHFPFEIGAAWGEIPDGVEPAIALRKGLVTPAGRHTIPLVHGPTTALKLARKAGVLRPKI